MNKMKEKIFLQNKKSQTALIFFLCLLAMQQVKKNRCLRSTFENQTKVTAMLYGLQDISYNVLKLRENYS